MEYFDFDEASSGLTPRGREKKRTSGREVNDQSHPGDATKTAIGGPSDSDIPSLEARHTMSSTRFSRETVRILKGWLRQHNEHPYPTEEEMDHLRLQTGLKSTQIRTWFANARRRAKGRSAPPRSPSPSPPGAINIPGQHSVSLMTPLERWQHSPPEHEPAATINIIRAISERPREPCPIMRRHASWPSLPSENEPDHESSCDMSGVFPAPSLSSFDTERLSASNRSSCTSAFSHNSSSGTGSGRRHQRRQRRRKPARFANAFVQHKNRGSRMFQCTFCTDTFATKYDWQRHEKSLHLPLETWSCSPLGGVVPFNGKMVCVFCRAPHPDKDHLESHNYMSCQDKHPQERTFYRKDHLNQHLRYIHDVRFDKFMESWKSTLQEIKSRCGFCNVNFTTWDERISHLAGHFKGGADMRQWQGDWGFEPAVESRVANSMPPYLIGQERLTMNPFTADATNDLEHSTEINEPALRDQEDANSWRRLQQELTAYIKQQAAVGVVPTDLMLQDHARVVIYGCDDPWNQTCADNPVWLSILKRDNGIETVPDSESIQLDNLGMQPPFALNGGLQLPPLETNDMARTIYSRELRRLHSPGWGSDDPVCLDRPSGTEDIPSSYAESSGYASAASVPTLSTDWDTSLSTMYSAPSISGGPRFSGRGESQAFLGTSTIGHDHIFGGKGWDPGLYMDGTGIEYN
ncbi:hypothetical protein BO94DRAFT_532824 [Aspergillus sclerotioniger CBS 115572]|uniref:Homeobox and C2H2 transcription factor n=1 Tax=Aspergillus sclerotioniger CBS 115572 TaxID=1450535 RepID=A0A317X8Y2_9EURO|nr:hypothetical protein BO94DRAFT_532824 [Aspergillus sclerotioniger CBS 115572]PWY93010.1 hypothetical protein BO94DRAFT_532824 [Aspergillus sclerotioniger CBS 115572]